MRPLPRVPLFVLLASSPACVGDDPMSTSDSGETDTDTGTGAPEPDPKAALARGITITEIEANQGVAVNIALGADWIDGGDRGSRLIAGRPTLLRVHYIVEPEWVPRAIAATLTLEHGDGTRVVLEQVRDVETDSWPGQLDGTFTFELDPSQAATEPELAFQVALHEVGDESLGDSEGIPLSPSSGPAMIGFEDLGLLPEVVLVPVINPDIAEPTPIPYEALEQRLLGWLPTAELSFEIHAPVAIDGPVVWTDMLTLIGDLRAQEAPAPDVSYVGVVETEDGWLDISPVWTRGTIETADPLEADRRVAAAGWNGNLDELAQSFAHALYVHHRAQRVDCPGQGLGIEDPNYPYPDGKIGVWGFDITTGRLFHPNLHYDIASYCVPAWTSDYSWNRVISSLRVTSTW